MRLVSCRSSRQRPWKHCRGLTFPSQALRVAQLLLLGLEEADQRRQLRPGRATVFRLLLLLPLQEALHGRHGEQLVHIRHAAERAPRRLLPARPPHEDNGKAGRAAEPSRRLPQHAPRHATPHAPHKHSLMCRGEVNSRFRSRGKPLPETQPAAGTA